MIYLVALLVAVGAAFVGAVIGLGQFALAFELLREFDRDVLLDSRMAVAAFSFSFAAVGFAAGLMLVWRWEPAGDALPWWKVLTAAVLAGTGATTLAFLADVVGLTSHLFRFAEAGVALLILIAMAVLALVAGATLAVLTFARSASRWARIAAIPIAIIGAFAVIMGGLIADKRFTSRYLGLGSNNRTALIEIRMPTAMDTGSDAVRVALRTGTRTTPARDYNLERHAGHVIFRTAVNISERTRQRVLVISIAGRPDLTFPLHLVSNPRVMHLYGPWQPLGPDRDFAIRILTR